MRLDLFGRARGPRSERSRAAKTGWHFDVDVVGSCNLRCPSCPVGNSRQVSKATRRMTPQMLEQIVHKAIRECGRPSFALYNWTEPFLHPDLPELIRIVRSKGLRCALSTNLNLARNIDAVMAANANSLRISVSGFDQASYGITHEGGDIELVKQNMIEVARARERTRSRTDVEVCFHRYLGNHDQEARMKEYSESLGFRFNPLWAYLSPMEKILAVRGRPGAGVLPTEHELRLVDAFALPLEPALAVSRELNRSKCKLRDRQMALNSEGRVMLCCAVFDEDRFGLGSYLETPLARLQELKYTHSGCGDCMKEGIHTLYTYRGPEFDRLALANVARHHPDARLEGLSDRPHRRRPRGIASWPRKIRARYLGLVGRSAR